MRYFNMAVADTIQFITILDADEVAIARRMYHKVVVECNVVANVTLDGTVVGVTPCTVAVLSGIKHTIALSADGYIDQQAVVSDSTTTLSVVLETGAPVTPTTIPWWMAIINWILNKIRGK